MLESHRSDNDNIFWVQREALCKEEFKNLNKLSMVNAYALLYFFQSSEGILHSCDLIEKKGSSDNAQFLLFLSENFLSSLPSTSPISA